MSRVFVAEQTALGRRVVVKVLAPPTWPGGSAPTASSAKCVARGGARGARHLGDGVIRRGNLPRQRRLPRRPFSPAADRALYQAKAEGRNRVRCAVPGTVQKAT